MEDVSTLKAAEFSLQNLFSLPVVVEFKVYTRWENINKDMCCNG